MLFLVGNYFNGQIRKRKRNSIQLLQNPFKLVHVGKMRDQTNSFLIYYCVFTIYMSNILIKLFRNRFIETKSRSINPCSIRLGQNKRKSLRRRRVILIQVNSLRETKLLNNTIKSYIFKNNHSYSFRKFFIWIFV